MGEGAVSCQVRRRVRRTTVRSADVRHARDCRVAVMCGPHVPVRATWSRRALRRTPCVLLLNTTQVDSRGSHSSGPSKVPAAPDVEFSRRRGWAKLVRSRTPLVRGHYGSISTARSARRAEEHRRTAAALTPAPPRRPRRPCRLARWARCPPRHPPTCRRRTM